MPWPAFLPSVQAETVSAVWFQGVRTDQKFSSGRFFHEKLQSDELETIFREAKISADLVLEQWVAAQTSWQVGFHPQIPSTPWDPSRWEVSCSPVLLQISDQRGLGMS